MDAARLFAASKTQHAVDHCLSVFMAACDDAAMLPCSRGSSLSSTTALEDAIRDILNDACDESTLPFSANAAHTLLNSIDTVMLEGLSDRPRVASSWVGGGDAAPGGLPSAGVPP